MGSLVLPPLFSPSRDTGGGGRTPSSSSSTLPACSGASGRTGCCPAGLCRGPVPAGEGQREAGEARDSRRPARFGCGAGTSAGSSHDVYRALWPGAVPAPGASRQAEQRPCPGLTLQGAEERAAKAQPPAARGGAQGAGPRAGRSAQRASWHAAARRRPHRPEAREGVGGDGKGTGEPAGRGLPRPETEAVSDELSVRRPSASPHGGPSKPPGTWPCLHPVPHQDPMLEKAEGPDSQMSLGPFAAQQLSARGPASGCRGERGRTARGRFLPVSDAASSSRVSCHPASPRPRPHCAQRDRGSHEVCSGTHLRAVPLAPCPPALPWGREQAVAGHWPGTLARCQPGHEAPPRPPESEQVLKA